MAQVSAFAQSNLIRSKALLLAQTPDLIVDELQDSIDMLQPIALRFGLVRCGATAVAYENSVITLPSRFQTQVAIPSAVGKNHSPCVGLALKIAFGRRSKGGAVK